jgi:leader peptidase (prepilin peptidase)/N-methyltransferase
MLIALGFLFGCFIGSFLNVCIHRLPRNLSVAHPPSRCGACGTRLTWYDNLPIIGYLMLRGHCRFCGTSFSPRYLVMELAVGALTAGVLWLGMGMPPTPWLHLVGVPTVVAQGLGTAALLAFACMLFVAAVIDFDHRIIPDEVTKPFQWAMPFLAMTMTVPLLIAPTWTPVAWIADGGGEGAHRFACGSLVSMTLVCAVPALVLLALSLPLARFIYSRWCPPEQRWSDADHRAFAVGAWWFVTGTVFQLVAVVVLARINVSWSVFAAAHLATAVLGSLAGWCSLYAVGLIGTVAFRRNAMGYGDVKMLAPIGAVLGPVGVLLTIGVAAAVGVLVGLPLRLLRAQVEFPFGPSLAVGAVVVLVWGPQMWHALTGG